MYREKSQISWHRKNPQPVLLVLDEEGGGVIDVDQLEADGSGVHIYEDYRVGLQVDTRIAHSLNLRWERAVGHGSCRS